MTVPSKESTFRDYRDLKKEEEEDKGLTAGICDGSCEKYCELHGKDESDSEGDEYALNEFQQFYPPSCDHWECMPPSQHPYWPCKRRSEEEKKKEKEKKKEEEEKEEEGKTKKEEEEEEEIESSQLALIHYDTDSD